MSKSYRDILAAIADGAFVRGSDVECPAELIALETKCINVRRTRQKRPKLKPPGGARRKRDCTGLAISGGGIRSAAFSLGALQALHQDGVLAEIDYLSTVSGGGYIGTSLTSGLDVGGGEFPFTTDDGDKSDNLAVAHLRNYSNYLIPKGLNDVLASFSVILRGLAANFIIVAGILLVAAGITLAFNPNQEALSRPDILGWQNFPGHPAALTAAEKARLASADAEIAGLRSQLAPLIELNAAQATLAELERKAALRAQLQTKIREFASLRAKAEPADFFFTRWLLLAVLAFHAGWALWRSAHAEAAPEFVGPAAQFSKGLMWVVVAAAALELQPFALRGLFLLYVQEGSDNWLGWISQIVAVVTPYLAPVAAVAAFASDIFGDILKTKEGESGLKPRLSRLISKLILLLVALALPMTLWVAYLYITVAGDIGFSFRPGWMQWIVQQYCGQPDVSGLLGGDTRGACTDPYLFARLYISTGLALTIGTWLFLTPNGNSLHRLYRDRLSKAFLFDPRKKAPGDGSGEPGSRDPAPLDTVCFTALHPANGPLHLVNAALNIQGSEYVNQRGRNADFFQFSPVYCGSASTGYIRTDKFEDHCPGVDLATAMAVSGAAASSNMGANTQRSFSPTLALLNIRLGYWLRNPKQILQPSTNVAMRDWLKPYLMQEMLGWLSEESPQIYLTDGGHIENLGLYELLRRRCARIIVLDAEADPQFSFRSLVEAQRYARIDLGIRIYLPWDKIQASALALNADCAAGRRSEPGQCAQRTHVARGRIEYGPGEEGEIIYIKSSLTGDENDYVLDYKARYPDFPHQTTGDQMFSEEQFECYRALGFHAAHRVFAAPGEEGKPDW
ncbi:patatin-like phospholipase family protein [Bosea sp. 124]|uniref:patatin-like phospholipase family protein n=1 Tax=Bosea sp. 124 TaxID=2135642 RepID=UPI000D3C208D|nr:patatin-like phospholipase family protein [Bosea sp. 124]PTM39146.1 patatin-like phospholipase [Bosea sp. 124]